MNFSFLFISIILNFQKLLRLTQINLNVISLNEKDNKITIIHSHLLFVGLSNLQLQFLNSFFSAQDFFLQGCFFRSKIGHLLV